MKQNSGRARIVGRLWSFGSLFIVLLGVVTALPATSPASAADIEPHPTFVAAAVAPALADFPRPVLVPSASTTLFDGLAMTDVRVWAVDVSQPGVVFYGMSADLPGSELGQPVVGVGGSVGREGFERMTARSRDSSCAEPAAYCAWSTRVELLATDEAFYGLTVNGHEAIVTHRTCCRGEGWSVTWYDTAEDTTYGFSLRGEVAAQLGSDDVASQNITVAEQLVAVAAGFVPLDVAAPPPVARVIDSPGR